MSGDARVGECGGPGGEGRGPGDWGPGGSLVQTAGRRDGWWATSAAGRKVRQGVVESCISGPESLVSTRVWRPYTACGKSNQNQNWSSDKEIKAAQKLNQGS